MGECNMQFDLYADVCLDCGESDETIKLYEVCRANYLNEGERNQDNKIVNINEKGIGEVKIHG